jgi:hypothetical protein
LTHKTVQGVQRVQAEIEGVQEASIRPVLSVEPHQVPVQKQLGHQHHHWADEFLQVVTSVIRKEAFTQTITFQ